VSLQLDENLPFGVVKMRGTGWELVTNQIGDGVVWLCPECFQPSESGPNCPDEENRPCDCGSPLVPFVEARDTREVHSA
jgi:hypothetical protein